MPVVNLVLNVLWLVLAGFWLAVGYAVAGLICFVLIITIPFGIQAFKLAGFVLWPFGRHVEFTDRTVTPLRIIGNVLWIIFGGWYLAVHCLVGGAILCITIIGIPFGIQSFKLAGFALWPFGRVVVARPGRSESLSCVGNVLWFVLSGFWLALEHAVLGLLLCLTIIGIPLGLGNFKLIPLAIAPFGRDIVKKGQPLPDGQVISF
jgi:uncharacterized membrane protein YccF (DUF307 family)